MSQRRLLQLLRRAGTSTRALDSSKGRRPQPPSFSDAPRGSLARSDGARRAALRPFSENPGAGSSWLPRFARPRCSRERVAPRRFPAVGEATIDVHGPPDRAKDASPWREWPCKPSRRVLTHFWAWADVVPLLGVRRASFVAGASARRGGSLCARDGPAEIYAPTAPREGFRLPADRMLSTAATASGQKDRSSCLPASASRSRRPHVFPRLGKGAFFGPCKRSSRGVTRARASRVRAPLLPAGLPVPGTDDPSTPTWLGRCGRSRGLIAYARSTPAAAPRRLLRPRVRGAAARARSW
jgi:hypothetical protein